jgi:DNA (cytosine-5)-methyltransferase 1
MFPGLRVIRHRLFETNWPLGPRRTLKHPLVFTHDKRKAHYGKLDQDTAFVQVTGGGNCTVANKRDAMGVDWMTGREAQRGDPAGVHMDAEGGNSPEEAVETLRDECTLAWDVKVA